MMKIGRVYKIIALEGNEIYIGSTFNTTRDRFQQHKKDYNTYKQGKRRRLSCFDMFDKYGFEGCRMIMIKEYNVCDRHHLFAYEQLWMNKLSSINEHNAFTVKSIYEKCFQKKYRETHREKLAEINKTWRNENKEHCKQMGKEKYMRNKEEILKSRKSYYEANKIAINIKSKLYQKQRVLCDCGMEVSKGSFSKHKKTKQHFNKLSNIPDGEAS